MTTDRPTPPAQPAEDELSRRDKLRVLPRLLTLLRPHRGRLTVSVLALIGGSAVSLVYPMAARYAVDTGLGEGSLARFDDIVLGFLALVVLQALLVWVRHYTMSWIGQRAVADLRTRVYRHLLTLPSVWFHVRRSGEIVGRLAADVTTIQGVVGSELSFALRSLLQLLGGVVLLFTVDARLTLTALLVVPPTVFAAVWFGRAIRKRARRVQDHLADASAQVQESVGAIQTVQAFRREPVELRRYRAGIEGAFDEGVSLARWSASFFSGITLSGYLAMAIILWIGGRRVVSGELTAGGLVAFLLYTLTVASSLVSLAGVWSSLQRAGGATLRLFDILDTQPEIRDPDAPVPLPPGDGALELVHVDFAYPDAPDRRVLHDISFRMEPGEVVAAVGRSGSGKTTLTRLILRFYDPDRGCVRLDGVDVRTLRLWDLRSAVAIVSQEPALFYGSVRENIAFGRPGASAAEVERVARAAHADEFVRKLPQGYDTAIGERGVTLSGGQRQRIAIARALLCDPRLLILDEATSSLDAESEALVQDALAHLKRGRTTLVIAHRLSTVRDADRILVFDHGALVEQGTHQALMARSGTYRTLVDLQLREGGSPEPVRSLSG